MKKLFHIWLLIAAVSVAAFSQTNKTQNCPSFNISGPSEIYKKGEPVTFTATIDKEAEKYDLKFIWEILDAGTGEVILDGQGTLKAKVLFNDESEQNRTVILEIQGLPEGCPNTATETMPTICEFPESRLIDEFSLNENRIDKARLDSLINEAENEPSAQVYIIEKFSSKVSKSAAQRKKELIADYISKIRKQDISQYEIVIVEGNENLTQFWIVPSGAQPPEIDQ